MIVREQMNRFIVYSDCGIIRCKFCVLLISLVGVAVNVPGAEPTIATLPRISLFASLPVNVASFVCPSTFTETVKRTSPVFDADAFEISPAPRGPEIDPVIRSPSCCNVNVIACSPCAQIDVDSPRSAQTVATRTDRPRAGLRSTGRPSMNTCATRLLRSNRSPRVTVKFAIFPTSIDPS